MARTARSESTCVCTLGEYGRLSITTPVRASRSIARDLQSSVRCVFHLSDHFISLDSFSVIAFIIAAVTARLKLVWSLLGCSPVPNGPRLTVTRGSNARASLVPTLYRLPIYTENSALWTVDCVR